MSRLSSWGCLAIAIISLLSKAPCYGAVPATETLLPNTTKGFLSIASIDALRENWGKTQLGQMMQDPAMKDFIEDFRRQIQQKWTQTHQKLGITWDDLDGVPAGEVSVALILPSPTEVAFAILVDVTGHQQQAEALLEKINHNMTAKKATRTTNTAHGATITVFEIPKHEETPVRHVAYVVKDDLLIASDNPKVIEGILARLAPEKTDALASLPAFEAIAKRCTTAAGDLKPNLRWFIEPFGYVDATRLASEQPRRRGTDMLKILKGEGFPAVQGIGGFVNFSAEPYEMIHRTFIFAPGNAEGERFTKSARMLDFPNGDTFTPPDWVPKELAGFASIYVNIKSVFENSKTLVNEIVGDEVFEDVLESIRTDENGPRIDIRSDVIAFLGKRVMVMSDLQLPITPKSERVLIAVETADEKHTAEVIKKWMESDPDVRRLEINGHVVWEIVDQKAELPMVTIENSPLAVAAAGGGDEEEPEEKPLLPNSAVTVAYGQLLIATHIDILTKILTLDGKGEKLSASADYQRVQAEVARLAQPQQFGQTFTRTDEAYRGVYELLRTGKMPEAESMVGKLLNALMGEGKEGVLRTQRIDGSKLPEFEQVRRYLGPASSTLTTESDGWFVTGFLLKKTE